MLSVSNPGVHTLLQLPCSQTSAPCIYLPLLPWVSGIAAF